MTPNVTRKIGWILVATLPMALAGAVTASHFLPREYAATIVLEGRPRLENGRELEELKEAVFLGGAGELRPEPRRWKKLSDYVNGLPPLPLFPLPDRSLELTVYSQDPSQAVELAHMFSRNVGEADRKKKQIRIADAAGNPATYRQVVRRINSEPTEWSRPPKPAEPIRRGVNSLFFWRLLPALTLNALGLILLLRTRRLSSLPS